MEQIKPTPAATKPQPMAAKPAPKPAQQPKPAAPPAKKPIPSVKPEEKVPRVTISGVCRDLIKAGKTNEQIWAIIKPKFKMDDSKKHYPAWFRSQVQRQKKDQNKKAGK